MDSSFRTERTETTTSVARTIRSISSASARPGRPAPDARHDLCWCGQDMDVVRGSHCPRCGTMRAARVGSVLPRLAA